MHTVEGTRGIPIHILAAAASRNASLNAALDVALAGVQQAVRRSTARRGDRRGARHRLTAGDDTPSAPACSWPRPPRRTGGIGRVRRYRARMATTTRGELRRPLLISVAALLALSGVLYACTEDTSDQAGPGSDSPTGRSGSSAVPSSISCSRRRTRVPRSAVSSRRT